jgi:hypothetical protein
MSVIPALGKLRQKDHKFEASLNYISTSYLKDRNKSGRYQQLLDKGKFKPQ